MEQNRTVFTIICNEKKYLEECLLWYNSLYKTDFQIQRFILDEVNFAEISATIFELKDVFNIGYAFGSKEQKLRMEGKIDW